LIAKKTGQPGVNPGVARGVRSIVMRTSVLRTAGLPAVPLSGTLARLPRVLPNCAVL
jgi:hypothetical protein